MWEQAPAIADVLLHQLHLPLPTALVAQAMPLSKRHAPHTRVVQPPHEATIDLHHRHHQTGAADAVAVVIQAVDSLEVIPVEDSQEGAAADAKPF